MHPLLIQLGPIPIHTYGFLIAVGFILAIATIRKLATLSKLDVERTIDLAFWVLLVGFIGSRILFVITQWQNFRHDLLGIFRVWEGGLVFLGGPLLVVPFSIWYIKKYKLPGWKTFDVSMPGLVIAHAFGRLGCLASGCCYGKPTHTDFGIVLYSELVDPSLRGIKLHPTQLYESTALFILYFGMLWVYKKRKFDGQVALTYYLGYPIIRSIVEIFRGDQVRGFVISGILSTSQFISIFIFGIAAWVLTYRLKQVNAHE